MLPLLLNTFLNDMLVDCVVKYFLFLVGTAYRRSGVVFSFQHFNIAVSKSMRKKVEMRSSYSAYTN